MKSALSICFIITTGLFAGVKTHAQQSILTDNPLKNKLDSAVHQAALIYLKNDSANGLVIGVTQNGQRRLYRYGENVKGSGQLTPPGLYYNIGSVAKTFVATMLAVAVTEKKAALHDDIRKYLPGTFDNLQFNGHPIRLVDLANHTSGLPGSFHDYSWAADRLKGQTLSEQADFFATYTQDSLLADLHRLRPDTIPGTRFRYNSAAYMLLTCILERIYRQSYDQLVTTYLQKHFGMLHTTPLLTRTELRNTAQGYNRQGDQVAYINLKGYFIGPSMNATVSDIVSYLQAQLAEKNEAIRLSHRTTFGKTTDGFGVGLGWMANVENGQRYFYHDGNTKLGFNTLCTVYPGQQLGIVIIANDVVGQDRLGQLENNIRKFM
ncbi:beta-lactamase family protein [Chitinophaga varians]|uniref:Beta-lactamase family protein n=1 Tax=Chitinophaga varians TaxID=2202339 RepID=A0A847RJ79_9BACT|nr:serine hydrolase domain-containing protein [Chitinophaga varians]NLR63042.1 beta-lactamase family protein [Chitinophaga varians]